ncbi:hypothetical protein F5051DRAFT_432023 [Lentinula edodes]|nr:hypothetical protein F5051DRAFT_432023 [Lentinula edodes]
MLDTSMDRVKSVHWEQPATSMTMRFRACQHVVVTDVELRETLDNVQHIFSEIDTAKCQGVLEMSIKNRRIIQMGPTTFGDMGRDLLICKPIVESTRSAYESLFESVVFEKVEDLLHAGEAWSDGGGRVYPLIKTLQLGVVRPTSEGTAVYFTSSTHHLEHYVELMTNVKKVFIIDAAIGGDLLTTIARLWNLRTLSLERVSIMNAVKDHIFESMGIQHLRLLNITWNGHSKVGRMIQACHALRTLCITWHDEGEKEGVGWETWSNASCRQVTVVCKPTTLDSKYGWQTLLAVLGKFECLTELRVKGTQSPFTEDDTPKRPFSQSVEKLLLVTKQLHNLEINFSDNVNEPEELLGSVADMLDFNPPLRSLHVTGDDPFESAVNHNHFRTMKALCPELEVIGVDDRRWRNVRGLWMELLPHPANFLGSGVQYNTEFQ